jgi:hypothetical protein
MLLCSACGDSYDEGYVVVGFLGASGRVLAKASDTPISIVICKNHSLETAADLVPAAEVIENDLVFSLASGSSKDRESLSGAAFSMGGEPTMRKNADFDRARFASGTVIRRLIPQTFDSLMEARSQFSGKLNPFKEALDAYAA